MKRVAILLLLLVATACASSRKGDDASADILPPPAPAQSAASEARLAELQTSLTELLERIDVLNDRIARLEAAAAERVSIPTPVPQSQPASTTPVGAQPSVARAVAQPRPADVQPPAPPATSMSASKPLLGAHIADLYRGALELYGKNKMAEARKAFQQVFDADPAGELADNALYWMGETYFVQANYAEAMRYYTRVTKEYPNENKAPDAMFKMGMTYEKTGDLALAKQALEECIKRYPYSTPAASAKAELKRIKY
jgi:tol-pal system protein YbgF